jgi:hypothetical protein
MASGSRSPLAFITGFRVFTQRVEYRTYLRSVGWTSWQTGGETSNQPFMDRPVESIQFRPLEFVPGEDIAFRALFGTRYSAGFASREDKLGTPGSGQSLQILQLFSVSPIRPDDPAMASTRNSLRVPGLRERFAEVVTRANACTAGIGRVAPECLEWAGLCCYSDSVLARISCVRATGPASALIECDQVGGQDKELGTTEGDLIWNRNGFLSPPVASSAPMIVRPGAAELIASARKRC